jgi:hypothetical protein
VKFRLVLAALAILAFALFEDRSTAPHDSTVSGFWSDACPCKIPCPCWRTGHSSAPKCLNLHLYRILQDDSETANLRGLQFVVLESPDAPYAAPVARTVFVDSLTSDGQIIALTGLAEKYLGHVQFVRQHLVFRETRGNQRLEIPDLLSFNIEISNSPPQNEVSNFLYSWLKNPKQGVASEVWYGPAGQEAIKYSGTNALTAEFHMVRQSR